MDTLESLREKVKNLERIIREKDSEIEELREKLRQSTENQNDLHCLNDDELVKIQHLPLHPATKLNKEDIARYSRQLILPEFGVKGQLAVKSASVLIVGCGGLGCPVAIYLAAAGIGRLGLVDYDDVELSNLHRQVLHTESSIGRSKSQSVADGCRRINSQTVCIPYRISLNSSNAKEIIEQYDIVVDATDNVATRYLLSDACVLAAKPLVSGSALRFEGQLTVYNHKGSPCYRCLYPVPPSPETVTNCSDGGVMGAVVGIIGCLQALEVIKIAADIGSSYGQRLLLFDGFAGTFKTVKLRGRKRDCAICGEAPTIDRLIDYEQFCGSSATDKNKDLCVLNSADRITVWDYRSLVESKSPHLLVDVRQPVELDICQLPTTTHNIPMDKLDCDVAFDGIRQELPTNPVPVFVVCRRGNDSQLAVGKLREVFRNLDVPIQDIKGGLHAWARHIDKDFPTY